MTWYLAGIRELAQDESHFRDIAYVNRTPHPVDLDRVNYNIATDNLTQSIWGYNELVIPYDGPMPSNLELHGEERERYFIIDGTFTLAPAERKQAIITYLNDTYHYNFKPAHCTLVLTHFYITNLIAAGFIHGKNIKIPAYRLVLALKACQVDGTFPHF